MIWGRKSRACLPQPGRHCTIAPASSPPSLPGSAGRQWSRGVAAGPPVLHRPVPQTCAARLHILGPTEFLIRKPRQLAVDWCNPPLRFLGLLSVCVWVSQTPSGPTSVRWDPRADHGLPASVSPASFHQGLPPAPAENWPHGRQPPRLFPGCRASEAVDPIPLRCPVSAHPGTQVYASGEVTGIILPIQSLLSHDEGLC